MEYKNCYLYGLKSKKKLMELLHIDRKAYLKAPFINTKITPYIENNKRLIEAPSEDLKAIQRIVLKFLQKIIVPNNVFSGIKGKSFIDNAKLHKDKNFVFKVDISKFFPNIRRNRIYDFYKNKLCLSSDVSQILTDLSTVDLTLKNQDSKNMINVNEFIKEKNIKCINHLVTGSPLSCILSYFANLSMFNELEELAKKNNMSMTIYIDDVTFSSNKKINKIFCNEVFSIIEKYGYSVSKNKCKIYKHGEVKKITGVILDKKNQPQVPNRLILKTHNYLKERKSGNETNLPQLKGCIVVSKTINGKFKELHYQIKNTKSV